MAIQMVPTGTDVKALNDKAETRVKAEFARAIESSGVLDERVQRGLRTMVDKLKAEEKAASRPIGSIKLGRPPSGNAKVAVTLRIDPRVLEAFQAKGPNWRAAMVEALTTACPD